MLLPVLEKERIHRDNLIWLLLAQAFSIIPLLFHLPIWLVFFWMFAIYWRIQIHRTRWAPPNFYGKVLLGGFCVLAVYFSFQGISSVEPMIAFLVCSFVLKTVELQTKKDALIVLFIGFVAIACQFLFAQDLLSGMYGVFSLFVLLSAWQAAFFSCGLGIKSSLKRGGALILQSMPFMVVLFVIMPRIGPLWSVPSVSHQAKTGFGETLKLGDIGNLVRSSAVAFRVSFVDSPPALNQLYWRGLVLNHFDGDEWTARGGLTKSYISNVSSVGYTEATQSKSFSKYSIVLEPHSYPWIFSLKVPIAAQSSQLRILVKGDGLLSVQTEITQKSEYEVVSKLDADLKPLSVEYRQSLVDLPKSGNPRARALAQQWLKRYEKPEDIVAAALAYYSAEFSYTLQPALLSGDTIDQFLFESKGGFCEHFASSLVFLMRSAGIPSRIVLGYQGAHYNKIDDYFVVKQSDAHAWVEVWLNGRWQIIDPTTAVAPSRISLGIEQSLAQSDLAYLGASVWQSDLLLGMYHRWDALGFAWNRWVLNYDNDNQEGLLKKLLGGTSPWRVGLAFVGICTFIFLGYIFVQYFLKIRKPLSVENKLLEPVLRALTRRGYVREPGESVSEFSNRVLILSPAVGRNFKKVAEAYTLSVYSPGQESFERLKSEISKYQQ